MVNAVWMIGPSLVVFLNVWMNKYTRPVSGDPIFLYTFESVSYLLLTLVLRILVMGINRNFYIAINPQVLIRKFGFWPFICVGSSIALKYFDMNYHDVESDFGRRTQLDVYTIVTIAQLSIILLDGLVVSAIPRYLGPKNVGSTVLRDSVIRSSVAVSFSFFLGYFLQIKLPSLLFFFFQYMALDRQLRVINSNIAEVVITNYGLSTLFLIFYNFYMIPSLPSQSILANSVAGILWKFLGLMSLHALLLWGLARGLFVFTIVRLIARFLVNEF
eukprot:TRINITY_DN34_c0_g1_i1.p1 TRINITY_DN34_c0_g1~~TRINITY_DN34_c0_g1_i1.p1  ORF type:complete len:273 (+),score=23.50 TRINITY_DN34_c0_g1_i1:26-844(+)